jgi:DNA-binding NtrC family response regulator
VHVLSSRKGDFVPVNVAGLTTTSSPTRCSGTRGRFHRCHGRPRRLAGAGRQRHAFLDEIGDLSAVSQVKLLRLLQDGEYLPLGSDVAKRSDARIVVATNQDLEAARNSGKFRKDLYYRLCGHHVHITPPRSARGFAGAAGSLPQKRRTAGQEKADAAG